MQIAVDFGNTSVKIGFFEGHELTEILTCTTLSDLHQAVSRLRDADKCIIGSVTWQHEDFIPLLHPKCKLVHFTAQTPIPIQNKYQTTSTLGSDRLAASVGAFSLYPNKNTLVIDAGTCLKYNFTNEKNEYLGGAISPGLKMRFRALHEFTAKLPLLDPDPGFDKLIGQSTNESILSGVMNGFVDEADSAINHYLEQFPNLTVVVTGGDMPFLAKHLKNRIFAHPHMVLKGLNEILIYNS